MRVVEVIGGVAEGVDFEFGEKVLRDFLEEPVEDHTAFDAALGVQDEDHFGEVGLVEGGFNDAVATSNVGGCIGEVSLDKALDHVEENAVSRWI